MARTFPIPLARQLAAVLINCLIHLTLGPCAVSGEDGAIPGYTPWDSLVRQVDEQEQAGSVSVARLGTTLGGRDVLAITIGRGETDQKPSILIMGNVSAPHLVGSELALRLARLLAHDPRVTPLLDRVTFYVIPRPTPDASEAFFRPPYVETPGNLRPTDYDHDGQFGEDRVEDLDADGWIGQLRVEDPIGSYLPHPADERILIEADPKKNEHGRYRLHTEGRDNDQDEAWNEEFPGGVDFNRNFTFRYPFFAAGAGPHQVSEIETRAVANFAYDHPNIALVLTFTPQDNLYHPWKPDKESEEKRVQLALQSKDAPIVEHLISEYVALRDRVGPPKPADHGGTFSEWAYFHFGRWSLATPGWWIPRPTATEEAGKSTDAPKDERGAEALAAIRFWEARKETPVIPWHRIDHPDFPSQKVEVGGLRPFYLLNPPAEQLDPLTEVHLQYVLKLADLLPRLKIEHLKVESLGEELYRVSLKVVNHGFLPTMSGMGEVNKNPCNLQLELMLPKKCECLTGSIRSRVAVLPGGGGYVEHHWLVRASAGESRAFQVKVSSPCAGSDLQEGTLK